MNGLTPNGGPSNAAQSRSCRRGAPRPHIDFVAIAREAVMMLPAVLARVLPGGRVVGREYVVLNPRRIDHHLGSFKIRLTGGRAGAWADFATDDRGGDVISLVAYIEQISQQEAARRLARMLGIDHGGAGDG